ncbi:MAG TPA: D-cysteine desulfhydrase family protein [Candidatus Krumholzibacteria bacterium]|nr:D-cysteine desulfhydrase family protein [Candidatus Krumholzibacteria bacterium]
MTTPRFELVPQPTPLHPMRRLSAELDIELWIKRDDLTGLAFGGNKTRKLEFLVGDALARGADTLVTSGAVQSNHCRQTAAAAACAGLECHLALGGADPGTRDGNLLLDDLLGAHLHWCGEARKGETVPTIVTALRERGRSPVVVPYGGSNPIGARGYVRAAAELREQCEARSLHFDAIVFASSSGGTQAGLCVGMARADLNARGIGVRIDPEPGPNGDLRDEITELIAALDTEDGTTTGAAIEVVDEFAVPGYGTVTARERDAVHRSARTEGVLLDPVYTARAFGGLLAMTADGRLPRASRVLFWHTGGTPALFPYADWLRSSSASSSP